MKYDLDGRVVPTINCFRQYDNGGAGSGNFGHSGRPGKVGGSSSHGSGGSSRSVKTRTGQKKGYELGTRIVEDLEEKYKDIKEADQVTEARYDDAGISTLRYGVVSTLSEKSVVQSVIDDDILESIFVSTFDKPGEASKLSMIVFDVQILGQNVNTTTSAYYRSNEESGKRLKELSEKAEGLQAELKKYAKEEKREWGYAEAANIILDRISDRIEEAKKAGPKTRYEIYRPGQEIKKGGLLT